MSGAGRLGSCRSPVKVELIVSPFGSDTRMWVPRRTLLSCTAYVSLSKM